MIFVYHRISFKSKNENTVTFFKFFLQMLLLKLSSYKVVSFEEYLSNMKNSVVITFDDGFKDVLKYACPILKLFSFPFEVFVCEKYVKLAEKDNDTFLNIKQLMSIVKNGGHIQYHSKSHINLTTIDEEKYLIEEIIIPEWLKFIDKNGFKIFAYPYWSYNEKIKNIVEKYYKAARSGNGFSDKNIYALDALKVLTKYWNLPKTFAALERE